MDRTLRLRSAALALVCLLGSSLAALGQTTTITASHLKMGGFDISTGEVLITPVNAIGTAIPFADATGAQNGPTSFACQIVAGAITGAISETGTVSGACTVPDATLTTPSNILYSIQVLDQSTGLRTSGAAYTMQQVVGVSGSTWALDHYGPPASTTNVAAVQAVQGATTPSSCVAPSVFTNLTTDAFSTCVGGVFINVASSGGVQIGGDIGGSNSAPKVTGLQGYAISATAPTTGKALIWNGTAYVPTTPSGSSFPSGTANQLLYYAGSGTTLTPLTLGANLSITSATLNAAGSSGTPPLAYAYYPAAASVGGVGFSAAFRYYNNNTPTAGSVNSTSSGEGYLQFAATPSSPQYAEVSIIMPPFWTSVGAYLTFYSPSTSGNAVLDIETACVTANQVEGSPTWSTAIVTTKAVSSTANGHVQTALIPNIAAPGANGCPLTGMTTPTSVLVRVFADATSAVVVNYLGMTTATGASE